MNGRAVEGEAPVAGAGPPVEPLAGQAPGTPAPVGRPPLDEARRLLPWFLWAHVLPLMFLGRWLEWAMLATIGLLVVAAYGVTRERGGTGRLLGLRRPGGDWVRHVKLLLLPVFLWPRLLGVPFQLLWPEIPISEYPGAGLWLAITVIILVPLAEELLFRGVLLGALRPFGRFPAMLISSVLFGMGHGPVLFLSSAAIGWVLGWLAWEHRSIWPGFLLHAAFNLGSGLGFWALFGTAHEIHVLPVALGLAALLLGGLAVTWRQRRLIRRVLLDPWEERPARGEAGRTLWRAWRLWPVATLTGFAALGWVLMFVVP